VSDTVLSCSTPSATFRLMGRPRRVDVGGYVYHVLNRSVGRRRLFHKEQDFIAFERVLAEALQRTDGAVLVQAYCVMGNHWHLVLRTMADGTVDQTPTMELTTERRHAALTGSRWNLDDILMYIDNEESRSLCRLVIECGGNVSTGCPSTC